MFYLINAANSSKSTMSVLSEDKDGFVDPDYLDDK